MLLRLPWYCCLVEDILTFEISVSVKNRARLARVVNTASKIVGAEQRQL